MIEEPPLLTINRAIRRPTAEQIRAFQGVPGSFVLDAMYGEGAMSANIRPVGDGRDIDCVAAGPALTVHSGPADILGLLAALKFVQPGDVVINAVDGHQGCAAIGDRVAGMLKNTQAAGVVTDGPMRDYQGIVAVGLPCWCTGLTPASPFSKGPGTVGLPVQIGGVRVESGDMVVADRDGVVVVPFDSIDHVIGMLDRIRESERDLDAKVAAGLKVPDAIEQLLDGDQVKYLD